MADFRDLLVKAYQAIKNKQFDKAITLYRDISEKYNNLSESKKTEKLRDDIEILFKELSIYIRINEAYIMAQEGDLVALKLALDYINDLQIGLQDVPDAKHLLDYADKHYKFFLDIYTYKFTMKEFNELYHKVKELSNERKITEAIRDFSHLLMAYNTVSRFANVEEKAGMYKKIQELLRDLEVKRKLKQAYKDKIFPEAREIPQTKKLEVMDKKQMYHKINEAVKKSEYSKISETF